MSVYIRFIELGTSLTSASLRVLEIGATDSDPRLAIYTAGSPPYSTFFSDASGNARASALSGAPSIGNVVELLVTLSATGVIQISQSINGAAATSGASSATLALPQAWSGATMFVNASKASTNIGFIGIMNLLCARSVMTLDQMRVIAGTNRA